MFFIGTQCRTVRTSHS